MHRYRLYRKCGKTDTHIRTDFWRASLAQGHLGKYTHRHKSTRPTHTYTTNTHTTLPYPCSRLIACTNTFLLHDYRSVSLARMRRYTQLAYLFHQCVTSILSRDGRMADSTERRPGERLFSTYDL